MGIIGTRIIQAAKQGGFSYTMAGIITLDLTGADKARIIALGERQVRFVMAKTLTQTAKEIQESVKNHIYKDFVIRKTNFPNSIKIRPATRDNLETKIYTMAGFAALQQTGGKQLPKSGNLAVPRYNDLHELKATRKTNVPGSFLIRLQSGGRAVAIRQQKEMRILYYLKNLAYMPKRLNMLEIGEDTAQRRIPQIFRENLIGTFDG